MKVRLMVLAAALAALAGGTASAQTAPAPAAPTATVAEGRLAGKQDQGVVAFLGVPFAAPPTGDLRWRKPAPAAGWTGTRDATRFSASCPQALNPAEGRQPWTPEYLIPGAMAEDCLYLNIWRRAAATGRRAPVLVWFHGGGSVEGSGSVPVYDGAALARQGVVVVTVNYRLGVLGFLSAPLLDAEGGGSSGNYALADAMAALRWVRENIAAFGGDPARVTIAGQSAGSGMVGALMAVPSAAPLFARAITQSGSGWIGRPGPAARAVAQQGGVDFIAKTGATSLAALRALPADRLVALAASSGARFGLVLDGTLLPLDPNRAQASGRFNDTPILSGFNWDERSGMDAGFGTWGLAGFRAMRDQMFGPVAEQAATVYDARTDAEANEIGKAMLRDWNRGSLQLWAERRAAMSVQPIYAYFFRHPEPGPTQARYGTFHSGEIPYVFANLDAPRPFDAGDRRVAAAMSARWVSFIKGGTPNAAGLPAWQAFDNDRPQLMLLGDVERPQSFLSPDKTRLFAAFAAATDAARP